MAPGRRDPRSAKHPVDGEVVTLGGAFRIDVFPTTNADYERFARATGHRSPQHWPGGRCPDGLFDHPVVWVTWHDAAAYARWSGKTLPTARQWEKAAPGPKGGIYPWGDEPTAAKCNVAEAEIGRTTPVARYQAEVSPYGVFDLREHLGVVLHRGEARPVRTAEVSLHLTVRARCPIAEKRGERHHGGQRHLLPLRGPHVTRRQSSLRPPVQARPRPQASGVPSA